jgi:branched-chain amino acid transport system permease protein
VWAVFRYYWVFGIFLVIIILTFGMSILPQLIANSLIAAGTYALVAMGFSLIYGATKFFNLAHGAMVAIGGYAAFFLLTQFQAFNNYTLIAVVIAALFAGLCGYILDRIVYFPLRKRKASNMVLLVASLGAFTVIQAVIAMFFTSQYQTIPSAASDIVYKIANASITQIEATILVSTIGILILLVLLLKKTLFGKEIRAISDDEEVAKIVGINTERVIGWTFFIGSAVAGFAGILIGFDTGLQPTMGLQILLKGVIAAIVGGIGDIYGAVLGALLLGFAENFGIWKINGEWKDSIAFGVLILFLIFRPQGIMKK